MLNRARQSLDGLSVGDAFGERFFVAPELFARRVAERAVPEAPWYYTDDTAMALSIYEVLEQHGGVDQDALAAAFTRRWAAEPDRGYGGGAHDLLHRIALGGSWRELSPALFSGTGSMGNGGAMRVAPLGAYFADDLERAAAEARLSAEVTHAHPEGQAGAIAVAIAAAWACGQRDRPDCDTREMFARVLEYTPESRTRDAIATASTLALTTDIATAARILGNGSRVISEDTVPLCLWCVARHPRDYVEAMWTTVAGGGDRDTTCAIVGGIIACIIGSEAIPETWLQAREPL